MRRRRFSPATLARIAGIHALAILAALTARMALPDKEKEPPLIVDTRNAFARRGIAGQTILKA